MIERPFWLERLHEGWQKVPLVWLTGVRRVGKTTLAASLPDATFLNCDLFSVQRQLDDPERFYSSVESEFLIMDEVHQLPDPSRVLKIATDEFKHMKILATGSSTLAATEKFRDALTGRKRVVHLVPVLAEELGAFGVKDLRRRLLVGGLPQNLLSPDYDTESFGEWMDSFFARDIQELFKVEKRMGFLKLLETVLRQSGSLAEVTSFCPITGLSRPTVTNYLQALETTHAITILRPYSGGGGRELIAQPKIYGFDTGFVSYCRGWNELREDDCGILWGHLVLETLQSLAGSPKIQFWRDKDKFEIDFVIPRGRNGCDTIECKWSSAAFEVRNLKRFREKYPKGKNFLISPQSGSAYERTVDGMKVTFANLNEIRRLLS